MKTNKKIITILGLTIFLIMTSNSVSAETDATSDIWHWKVTGTSASWEYYSGSKDYIDIINIDYSITGSEATLTMTCADDIQTSTLTYYHMHLLTGSDYYIAMYYNGMGTVIGSGGQLTGYYSFLQNPVNGNTFTATFTVNDPSASYELRGYAQELTTIGNENTEWWGDWAPDDYFYDYSGYSPDNSDDGTDDIDDSDDIDDGTDDTNDLDNETDSGDSKDDNGSPGFEIVIFISALVIALSLFKRRKK